MSGGGNIVTPTEAPMGCLEFADIFFALFHYIELFLLGHTS